MVWVFPPSASRLLRVRTRSGSVRAVARNTARISTGYSMEAAASWFALTFVAAEITWYSEVWPSRIWLSPDCDRRRYTPGLSERAHSPKQRAGMAAPPVQTPASRNTVLPEVALAAGSCALILSVSRAGSIRPVYAL